jgi:tetratricopeptide (TPR) repeat protein
LLAALVIGLPGAGSLALDRDELPEAFGVRYVTAGAIQPRVLPPLQSAPEAEAWRRRIQEREWRQGPYGPDISETLLDAGNYFYSRGDYRSAIAHWRRAVHLIRVNDGLYSELQLPTLQRLLETYLAIGDLESADGVQSYLYFLSRENHAPGDPEYIEATVNWVDWARHRWLREPNAEDPGDLMSLWRLLDRETRETEEVSLTVDQLEPLVMAQLRTLYVIESSDFGLDRETEMMLGRSYGAAADPNVDRTHIQALQEAAYTRGRQRLEELAERLSAAGLPARRAAVLKALGDWDQWHGRVSRAAKRYLESWRLLTEAGRGDLQTDWYGEPVELPADGIMWSGSVPPNAREETRVVVARFTVNERGRPRDVETRAVDPEHEGSAVRLYRMLRDSRFRPRLVDGEPVATTGVEREYRLF